MTNKLREIPSTLVPVSEAAMRLRLTRDQAVRRVMTGVLPGAKIGARYFVDRAALPQEESRDG